MAVQRAEVPPNWFRVPHIGYFIGVTLALGHLAVSRVFYTEFI